MLRRLFVVLVGVLHLGYCEFAGGQTSYSSPKIRDGRPNPFFTALCSDDAQVIDDAKVSTAEDAFNIAFRRHLINFSHEGINLPTVIVLDSDWSGFGKKGDKVWKMLVSNYFRLAQGEEPVTSATIWVHSQTEQVKIERHPVAGVGKSDVGSMKREHEKTAQREMDEKAKQAIKGLGRYGGGGPEQERENAIAILKEGSRTHDDDLALIVLYGIQRHLTGMRGTEWTPAVVSNYYVCVSHLNNISLDAETKANWRNYSKLKDMAYELNGGDKMLSLVIRGKLLIELKQYFDRAKMSNAGKVQDIQAFIRKESKAMLQEWPESELRETLEMLAADQQQSDRPQE